MGPQAGHPVQIAATVDIDQLVNIVFSPKLVQRFVEVDKDEPHQNGVRDYPTFAGLVAPRNFGQEAHTGDHIEEKRDDLSWSMAVHVVGLSDMACRLRSDRSCGYAPRPRRPRRAPREERE